MREIFGSLEKNVILYNVFLYPAASHVFFRRVLTGVMKSSGIRRFIWMFRNFFLPLYRQMKDMDMEKMIYTNKDGAQVYENVDRFNIRGTIMTAGISRVCDSYVHRLYVEDSRGGYPITVWDSAKGYDRALLKQGHSARFKGIIHYRTYMGSDGTEKVYKDYNATEMSAE